MLKRYGTLEREKDGNTLYSAFTKDKIWRKESIVHVHGAIKKTLSQKI